MTWLPRGESGQHGYSPFHQSGCALDGLLRVQGFYVQTVKTEQTGQMHRSLRVAHRSFCWFCHAKILNYVCSYVLELCSFIRFTPLSFTEASLQCINWLLRHTGEYRTFSHINTHPSVLWWRPIYLQCARNLFIGGKFEKLLWENLIEVSPQITGKFIKIPEINIKFINKNNIVINLNQPQQVFTVFSFLRLIRSFSSIDIFSFLRWY